MSSKNELVVEDNPIFTPTMSMDAAVSAFKQVQEVCNKILAKEDYAMIKIHRKDGERWVTEEKPFRKKSGSDKLSAFWGISTDTTKAERIPVGDDKFL